MNKPDSKVYASANRKRSLLWLIRIGRLFEKDGWAVLLTGVIGLAISLLAAAVYVPAPQVHDEFAYLLSADTFAQGRLTNPTHPHWPHFESFHVIHEPTYNSKYPPGQALVLAAGQRLGHPILGVCLLTGISMAAMVWMLIGWLPIRANFFVSAMVVTHPGLQLLWGQSYMGGSLALLGGALVLGSLIRMTDKLPWHCGMLMAGGILMLAWSRPFEGVLLTLTVASILGWRRLVNSEWGWRTLILRFMLPLVTIGLIGGSCYLVYNWKVTGDPLNLPYQVHEQTYGWTPLFLWQTAAEQPAYRHQVVEDFYARDFHTTQQKYQSMASSLLSLADIAVRIGLFFMGCSLVLGLLGLPYLIRQRRFRLAMLILLPTLAAGFVTPWGRPHYVAPVGGLLLLIALWGLLELWRRRDRFPTVRRWNWRALAALQLVWFTLIAAKATTGELGSWQVKRRTVETKLIESPGQDLVFVRYGDGHDPDEEWVYNRADIDAAEVVWAREMSPAKDLELIRYFSDHQVWLLQPESSANFLTPHPRASQSTSLLQTSAGSLSSNVWE